MAGIGHNSGRVDAPGHSWRRHVWAKARKDLLPKLPIEVIRLRVRRAAELGLPYKTYAGIRASTGHDLIGFLFSSNALQVLRQGQDLPATHAHKLACLHDAARIAAAHHPLRPADIARQPGIDLAFAAPPFDSSWSAMRRQVVAMATAKGHPADRLLMVGDTAFEREWAEAARMAGYLPADQFFDGA